MSFRVDLTFFLKNEIWFFGFWPQIQGKSLLSKCFWLFYSRSHFFWKSEIKTTIFALVSAFWLKNCIFFVHFAVIWFFVILKCGPNRGHFGAFYDPYNDLFKVTFGANFVPNFMFYFLYHLCFNDPNEVFWCFLTQNTAFDLTFWKKVRSTSFRVFC